MVLITRTIYHDNDGFNFVPERGAIDAVDFYGYGPLFGASSSVPQQELDKALITLHENITNGSISLHVVLGVNSFYGDAQAFATFNISITNLPVGATLVVSDDINEATQSGTTVSGSFSFANNTDGLAIDGIENLTTITISRSTYTQLDEWKLSSQNGNSKYISLAATSEIAISKQEIIIDTDALLIPDQDPGFYNQNDIDVILFESPDVDLSYIDLQESPQETKIVGGDVSAPNISNTGVLTDGFGNLVIHTGLYKFRNASFPSSVTEYVQLRASDQFFFNCLNFLVNGNKVRNGNTDVLIYTDGTTGNYGTGTVNGLDIGKSFGDTATLAGFNPVFETNVSLGSNISFSYFNQYAAVVILGVSGTSQMSASTIANLKTYFSQGNGLLIINKSSTEGETVTEIAQAFGADYIGSISRTSTDVKAMQGVFGQHPITNNVIGNWDHNDLESEIVIPSFSTLSNPVSLIGPGLRSINALVRDTTGGLIPLTFSYALNVTNPLTNNTPNLTVKDVILLDFSYTQVDSQDATGIIKENNIVIAEWQNTSNSYSINYINGSNSRPITKGTPLEISYEISTPVPFVENQNIIRHTSIPSFKLPSIYNNNNVAELEDINNTKISTSQNNIRIYDETNVQNISMSRSAALINTYFDPDN